MDDLLDENRSPPCSTGIPGLDDILAGGFSCHQLHLVEGSPGTGKTTLALQFLLAGLARGETVLYVTLSETRRELLAVGRSHGWRLDSIHFHEMEPLEESLDPDQQITLFHPAELKLSETTSKVVKTVEEIQPSRVVFDSLSEMRLLAQGSLRYRRQILGLKQFFSGRNATVLLLDDLTGPGNDEQLRSIAQGVIRLEQLATEYGAERRRLRVLKMRGTAFRGGLHDFVIRRGGLALTEKAARLRRRVAVNRQRRSTVKKMEIPTLSSEAKALLLQIAAGARLEWYRQQGHLGYRLDGQIVDNGHSIAELRFARLIDCEPSVESGRPVECFLSKAGWAIADVVRPSPA